MRVFMKPSNPTFGTKLFVSLVLLAISLCLVRCENGKPVPVTVEEKELTVTSAALASKITQILGKKVPAKQPTALYEGFKLEEIIPAGTTSTTFKPSQVTPATSGAPITEYEFAMPAGKTVKDYVQAALKDFTAEGKTKDQIKADLTAKFGKTSAEYEIKNEEEKITIQMTVPELEKFLYENFKEDKKIEQLPSTSPKQALPASDKGLFASMFGTATPLFDFTVYVPKDAAGTAKFVEVFCKACVDAVTTATPTFTDAPAAHKALLNQVLTNLKAPKDADVEAIKYSALIKGFEAYAYDATTTSKKIVAAKTTGTTAFTAADFKYADIVKPETFLEKFFYSFGEFDSTKSMPRNEILLDYLLAVDKKAPITGCASFQEALSNLLKAVETDLAITPNPTKKAFKAADPAAINFFLRSIKIGKDELQKSMEEIAAAKFQFKVAPEEIKVPAEKTPFTAITTPTGPSVKCAKFPRKSTDTTLPEIDLIKSYVEFVVKLVDEKKKGEVDLSKDAHDKIKTEFFKVFWDETVFTEYGKQLLTPAKKTTTPEGGDGGNTQEGSQKDNNDTTASEKEGLSKLTIILICIGSAAVLIAIALGVYYKVYAGKEGSEL